MENNINQQGNSENQQHVYQAGKLTLNTDSHKATVGDKIVHLTMKEYKLLEYFMKNVNVVIPRKKILHDVWGNLSDTYSNVIDVHVKNLRKKISARNSAIIETVRSVGYRLKVA